MVDELKTKPIEERKSQKVGFSDYAKEQLFWGLFPFIAGAGGYLLGKARIFPLDGSPMILSKLSLKLFSMPLGAAEKKQAVEELNELKFYLGHLPDAQRKELAKDIWNFLKTFEVAAVPSLYFLWKKKEGQNIGMRDVAQELLQVDAYKPSDAELAEENASLRQQLAFVRQEARTAVSPADATLEGKIAEPDRKIATGVH